MTRAGFTSITNVVSWVDPSPVMWYPDDLGRGSWDWEGQESAVLLIQISREAGVVKSRCAAPLRDKTRSRDSHRMVCCFGSFVFFCVGTLINSLVSLSMLFAA